MNPACILGKLPWQGIHDGSTIGRIKRIGIKKGSISPEELADGLNPGFCRSLKASRMLAYDQLPNFNLFRTIFETVLREERAKLKTDEMTFDWLEKNVNLEFGFDKKHAAKTKTNGVKVSEVAIEQGDAGKRLPALQLPGKVMEIRTVGSGLPPPVWNGEPPPTTPRKKSVNFKNISQTNVSLPNVTALPLDNSNSTIPAVESLRNVTQSLTDATKHKSRCEVVVI